MLKQYFKLRAKSPGVRAFVLFCAVYTVAGCFLPFAEDFLNFKTKEGFVKTNIALFFIPNNYTLMFGLFILLLTGETYRYFSGPSVATRIRTHSQRWYRLTAVLFLDSFLYILYFHLLLFLRALYFHQASACFYCLRDLLQCAVLQTVGCFFWMFLLVCIAVLLNNHTAGFVCTFLISAVNCVLNDFGVETTPERLICVYPGGTQAFGLELLCVLVVLFLVIRLFGYLADMRDYLPKEGREHGT